jgi:hypothetical protein
MEDDVKRRIVAIMGSIGLLAVTGCAGNGEVIALQLQAVPHVTEKVAKPSEPLRVAIGDFEDGRSYHTGLGVRTHLWGGVSYFDVPGGKPGEAVARALTDYLTAKGWHVVKQESATAPDVVITGKILELFVHAKSRVAFTEITTKTKLAIRANNSSDGSIVRMTLDGTGSEDVFWFDPEDVAAVLNDVLTDSYRKLIQDTKVENKSLRLTGP